MTTLSTNLDRLGKLCEGATPGPWHTNDSVGEIAWTGDDRARGACRSVLTSTAIELDQRRANAAYIAAANPTVVRALVEVAKAAQLLAAEANAVANGEGFDPLAVLAMRVESELAALEVAVKGEGT